MGTQKWYPVAIQIVVNCVNFHSVLEAGSKFKTLHASGCSTILTSWTVSVMHYTDLYSCKDLCKVHRTHRHYIYTASSTSHSYRLHSSCHIDILGPGDSHTLPHFHIHINWMDPHMDPWLVYAGNLHTILWWYGATDHTVHMEGSQVPHMLVIGATAVHWPIVVDYLYVKNIYV